MIGNPRLSTPYILTLLVIAAIAVIVRLYPRFADDTVLVFIAVLLVSAMTGGALLSCLNWDWADFNDRLLETRQALAMTPATEAADHDARLTKEHLDFLKMSGYYETIGLALLGSSGVGKSTLVNRLLGEERLRTREVRSSDDRGRHTTSARELLALPEGALIIDTPGMRELQLWGDAAGGLGTAFADVDELASGCRFGDCGHESEPGCAVRAAVSEGRLRPERLARYHKLQKKLVALATRHDKRLEAEQRRKWRTIHKIARHHKPRV